MAGAAYQRLPTPSRPPAMVRLSRTTYQDRYRVKSCVGFMNLRGPRAGRLASRVACRLMIVSRRCLGSRRPYGPQRTVQFLACTSPHPRNYAPAGAGRPLAEAREAAAGWLVALLARGCAGRRRRGTAQPAQSARSVLCPQSAPNHHTARPRTTRPALVKGVETFNALLSVPARSDCGRRHRVWRLLVLSSNRCESEVG